MAHVFIQRNGGIIKMVNEIRSVIKKEQFLIKVFAGIRAAEAVFE
jgi:hypothetical protein